MTRSIQPEAEVFGAHLKQLREQREETVRSLAARTGISYPFISDMERGLKVPSLTTLIRLAIALECDVAELVGVFTGRDLRKLVPKSR